MQKRLFLAAFICLALMLVQSVFFPPSLPPAEADLSAKREADKVPEEQILLAGIPSELAPGGRAAVGLSPEKVARIEHRVANDLMAVDLSNAGFGMIRNVEPTLDKFADKEGRGVDFLLLDDEHTLEFGFVANDTDFAWARRPREVVAKDDSSLTLRESTGEVEVTQKFRILEGYEAVYEVTVKNTSEGEQFHRIRVRNRLGEPTDTSRYNVHRGLCRTVEDMEDFDRDDVEEAPERIMGGDGFAGVDWIGLDSNYFLAALVPDGEPFTACEVSADMGSGGRPTLVNTGIGRKASLKPGESKSYRFGLYLGAKEPERLRSFAAVQTETLEEAVDWGYFGVVSEFLGKKMLALLQWFHDLTGIWGVAIIMLTICVKLVLLPLTLKQYRSMRKMREIQPEMEALRKKYGDDKQKEYAEMQALWKRSGASPLSGCLPVFMQFPVWIALYAMLGTAVGLYHEPFLWLTDLTMPDSWFILPIGMGGLMFLQMRIQPQAGDSQQQRMMQWIMPLVFPAMMWFMPSGLGVYIFANLVLSLIQSFIQIRPDKEWKKKKQEAAGN